MCAGSGLCGVGTAGFIFARLSRHPSRTCGVVGRSSLTRRWRRGFRRAQVGRGRARGCSRAPPTEEEQAPCGLRWARTLWSLPQRLHLPLALHPRAATLAKLRVRLSAQWLPWRPGETGYFSAQSWTGDSCSGRDQFNLLVSQGEGEPQSCHVWKLSRKAISRFAGGQ